MGVDNPRQLVLGVKLDDDATLANFYVGDANNQLLQQLQIPGSGKGVLSLYIWGSQGAGRTHLLQALCHEYSAHGRSAMYLPLDPQHGLTPEILDGLEALELVCVDDADAVCGDPAWELALFGLFNRCRDSGSRLLISASQPPADLAIDLRDLSSRWQSLVIYQLHSLEDEEKAGMLRLRAGHIGIELSDPVLDYILQRSQRSVTALLQLLDTLDRQSLEMKRRITVPLVREVMGW